MTEQYEGIGSFSILKQMIQLNSVGVQRREVLLAPKQQGPLTRQALLPVTDGVSLLISVPKCHLRASDTSLPKFRCPRSLLKTLHLRVIQPGLSLIMMATTPQHPSTPLPLTTSHHENYLYCLCTQSILRKKATHDLSRTACNNRNWFAFFCTNCLTHCPSRNPSMVVQSLSHF